jgi:hypothetical protein
MTMRFVLAMIISCGGCLAARAGQFSFGSRVGVVDTNSEGRLCLKISDPNLADGAEVSVVLPDDKPQRVARAAVEGKAAGDCSRNPGTDPEANFYLLKLVGARQALDLTQPMTAIAVVGPLKPVTVKRGTASGDLDGDGRAEFFRACSSSEGNHLTVWTGRPLVGKRRWHSYYYLGFDVVPDCKKKDYQ